MFTPSAPTIVRLLAPARISMPSRVRLTTTYSSRATRSEEHTSELQSPCNLVCRLLLEKKKICVSTPSHYIEQSIKYSQTQHHTMLQHTYNVPLNCTS